MAYWETVHTLADRAPALLDYAAIWRAADKIVYATTLQAVSSARTQIEREFDPKQVRQLKSAAERDISVGGRRGSPALQHPDTGCRG